MSGQTANESLLFLFEKIVEKLQNSDSELRLHPSFGHSKFREFVVSEAVQAAVDFVFLMFSNVGDQMSLGTALGNYCRSNGKFVHCSSFFYDKVI